MENATICINVPVNQVCWAKSVPIIKCLSVYCQEIKLQSCVASMNIH